MKKITFLFFLLGSFPVSSQTKLSFSERTGIKGITFFFGSYWQQSNYYYDARIFRDTRFNPGYNLQSQNKMVDTLLFSNEKARLNSSCRIELVLAPFHKSSN